MSVQGPGSPQEPSLQPIPLQEEDPIAQIAKDYLGSERASQALASPEFQLPPIHAKPSFFDWIIDFVTTLLRGQSFNEFNKQKDRVITLLSRPLLRATAADHAELDSLRDFVPHQYQERFSLWQKEFDKLQRVRRTLELSEDKVADHLREPFIPSSDNVEETLRTLQSQLGYSLLGEVYPGLREAASVKKQQLLLELGSLFEVYAASPSDPFQDHPILLRALLESPAIEDPVKDQARDRLLLLDSEELLADYQPVQSLTIMQNLQAIPQSSPFFPKASSLLVQFYLNHGSDLKDMVDYVPDLKNRLNTVSPSLSDSEKVKIGALLLNHGDVTEGGDLIEPLASHGHPEAQYVWGRFLLERDSKYHAQAAQYLNAIIKLPPQERSFIKKFRVEEQAKVGSILFDQRNYQDAGLWLRDIASQTHDKEIQWKALYSYLFNETDGLAQDRFTADEATVESLLSDPDLGQNPSVLATAGLNALFNYEKSLDPKDFAKAVSFLDKADLSMIPPQMVISIKNGFDILQAQLSHPEVTEEEVETANKAFSLLNRLPNLLLSEDDIKTFALSIAENYQRLAEKAEEGKKQDFLLKGGALLLQSGKLASPEMIDYFRETNDLLVRAQLDQLKIANRPKTTKTEQLKAVLRQETLPQAASSQDVLNAVISFFETLFDQNQAMSQLRLIEQNASSLSHLPPGQLNHLLDLILNRLEPTKFSETTSLSRFFKRPQREDAVPEAPKGPLARRLREGLASARSKASEALKKGMAAARHPFTIEENAYASRIAETLEKTLNALGDYSPSLRIAEYLLEHGEKAQARAKLQNVMEHSNDSALVARAYELFSADQG